ncbi:MULTISPECIES: sulfurtransferase-like selenium metabolism protein YedF [Fusobacterium]|jgi:selenium metabolism protein YedF|uniref:Sulfurtransferase-like selenium metabolism protein YedF n=1 Tax=Fusobacterium mortiferum ATCC 9817 TaxID=469616 RepID=A0ABM6TZ83_FUSMR|nr:MULTISPECIES: sulfurtransferase-like selenium metabolism protein YedF [Fusobacterium]AVQ19746.1 sulfurtransferase-like selenium metabolism protein YedF [Fusobacterium mortiferum ATCC 9817]EEO35823.1 selenium metabolism protein YedF [Fusobacterium mortiferum ATCC 9817]MCF2627097.1 sulfurtransferase-like selenium metabolism protein YedF [Fusobacterium mortiferum]MCI7665921.1 sulfurtransferase-like selenium metabolism protein YedF [Fusobacterium mortiferum]MDY2801873.1 sulfurtransferase-like s
MVKVDAIGQVCPVPIIMTKNALKDIEEGQVEVSVDNRISLENLQKMSKEMGYDYTVEESGDIFKIVINKMRESVELRESEENTVVVIDSLHMGKGDVELGRILMKGFIYTLSEIEELPKTILFYNEGVKLAIEGAESLQDLKSLEERGVEILSCGTCLNFYGITEKLRVGSVTNMYTILERQMKATRVIKP